MFSPIITLFKHFPLRAYITVLILVAISAFVLLRARSKWKSGKISRQRGFWGWLLVSYTLFIFFLAVLGRRSQDYHIYSFALFDSYREALVGGNISMTLLLVANISVFIPFGFLGTLLAKRNAFLKALLFGTGFSFCIELLQLLLRNGCCETVDLLNNCLGTLVGCLLALLCKYFFRNRIAV